MIDVRISTSARDAWLLDDVAQRLGSHLRVVPGADAPHAAPLFVTSKPLPGPFVVHPRRGVVVSTWESAGISQHAGIASGYFLLVASLLALAQWRVLRANALMRVDDFRHPAGVRCLFAAPRAVRDFAPLLNPPVVCRGCTDFYHCLGADAEMLALRDVIASIIAQQKQGIIESIAARRN